MTTRQEFIVTYDIADPKRLRKVFETMKGYGQWIQLSVFRCELNDREKVDLQFKLGQIIHHHEDQVLFIDIGPADGRAGTAIESVGRAFVPMDRGPVVV
jgi:CRISPR-associated protein Cas2